MMGTATEKTGGRRSLSTLVGSDLRRSSQRAALGQSHHICPTANHHFNFLCFSIIRQIGSNMFFSFKFISNLETKTNLSLTSNQICARLESQRLEGICSIYNTYGVLPSQVN